MKEQPPNTALIVFLGPRGVGKSTQIRYLQKRMKEKSIKNHESFVKTGILVGYIWAKLLSILLISDRRDEPPLMVLAQERAPLFSKMFRFWLGLDLSVITVKFLVGVYLPLKLGYQVITEDFFPSVINDYLYLAELTGTPLEKLSTTWNIMVRLMHKIVCTYTIFLDANPDVIKQRRLKRGDFESYPNFLNAQRVTLQIVGKDFTPKNEVLYINTSTSSVKEVNKKVAEYVNIR